jgi:plasmid maintenance system antidote protein VapI
MGIGAPGSPSKTRFWSMIRISAEQRSVRQREHTPTPGEKNPAILPQRPNPEVAPHPRVNRPQLSTGPNGKAAISAKLARRISEAFNTETGSWLRIEGTARPVGRLKMKSRNSQGRSARVKRLGPCSSIPDYLPRIWRLGPRELKPPPLPLLRVEEFGPHVDQPRNHIKHRDPAP